MLAELAVVGTKGGEKMGVDVEFAGNFTVDEYRYDDFRFGLEGTGRARRQQRRQRQWFYLQTQPPRRCPD